MSPPAHPFRHRCMVRCPGSVRLGGRGVVQEWNGQRWETQEVRWLELPVRDRRPSGPLVVLLVGLAFWAVVFWGLAAML